MCKNVPSSLELLNGTEKCAETENPENTENPKNMYKLKKAPLRGGGGPNDHGPWKQLLQLLHIFTRMETTIFTHFQFCEPSIMACETRFLMAPKFAQEFFWGVLARCFEERAAAHLLSSANLRRPPLYIPIVL